MFKYVFPNSKDRLPVVILLDTAIVFGALLGVNIFGGMMSNNCVSFRHVPNETTMDGLMVDFCITNNELNLASPTRTAANLKLDWHLTRKKLGLEPR